MSKKLTKEEAIKHLTTLTTAKFRTFGGGNTSSFNPIAAALSDKPPMFAAGVDVEDVIKFLIDELETMGENETF